MKVFGAAYAAALASMSLLDGLWLSSTARRFYAPRIGHLMAAAPQMVPAAVFYLIYAAGLATLIVLPAVRGQVGRLRCSSSGAFFGLVAYATYDLTNQATLRDWPLTLTLVDMGWGAVLTGVVCAVSYGAAHRVAAAQLR